MIFVCVCVCCVQQPVPEIYDAFLYLYGFPVIYIIILYIVYPLNPQRSRRECTYVDNAPGGIAIETDRTSSSEE